MSSPTPKTTVNWRHHGLGKRFETADLAQVDQELFSDIFDYAKNAKTYLKEGRGLLLSGPVGVGKTYAITALMKHLRTEVFDSRFDFQFVTAPDFFHNYDNHKESDKYRSTSWSKVYDSVAALVLNDLGKEDRSRDWLQEQVIAKLGRVLRHRHEEMLPVFITTNLPLITTRANPNLATVESTYGDSIWSLLYDLTAVRAQVHGDDRRKQKVANG